MGNTKNSKAVSWTDALRLPPGRVELAAIDPRSTPGFDGGKSQGKKALRGLAPAIDQLQEQLYAHGRSGGHRRMLLVLQGMDSAGKGGTLRHAVGLMDPQGVNIKAFKVPTPEEKRRGFLWRIKQALPAAGQLGVFDRSHYEDVLVARVRELASARTIEGRYDSINAFEADLVSRGCPVVKVMLHISNEEQKTRLAARLDNPDKHWKYNPGDVDERLLWDDYQRAYEIMLERCNTEVAPWFVVPADRKWYRNLAVTQLLIEHLRALDLDWPPADFDVETERRRVAES